jgi:hypothetical protein
LRQLDRWGWFYVLRQKSDTGVWLYEKSGWQPFGSYLQQPGQSIWLGHGYLTAKAIYPTNLLVHWQIGEPQPWCLETNLPDRSRMWIEGMFGGFNMFLSLNQKCQVGEHSKVVRQPAVK